MRRLLPTLMMVMAGLAAQAKSPPAELSGQMPSAALAGQASFGWLGFALYDAALFTAGDGFEWSRPFALELSYRRGIPGSLLVWATMAELNRIEGRRPDHPAIEQAVADCFPDVAAGDRILAVARSDAEIGIWFNGRKECDLNLPGLRDRFFGIWLSESSRAPELTRQLLGRQ